MTSNDSARDFAIPTPPARTAPCVARPLPRRRGALRATLLGGVAVYALGALVPGDVAAQVVQDPVGTQGSDGTDFFFPIVAAIGGDAGNGQTPTGVVGTNAIDVTVAGGPALRVTSTGGQGGEGGFGVSLAGYGEGGDGGNGGNGGTVDFRNDGDLSVGTGGGAYVASIGGRGGNGGDGVAGVGVGAGGGAGGGGRGGSVRFDNAGSIVTNGLLSHGVTVRSAGGVAGTGGVSGGLFAGLAPGTVAGGAAGSAEGIVSGSVETLGDISYGLLVQSIGGSGGSAGSSGGAFYASGGSGGSGGIGGSATGTVAAGGSVVTHGRDSVGVMVQSIGGGGGNGAGAGAIGAVGGSGGSGVDGGLARANIFGAVSTDGERAYGVLVQSIGGGGGDGSGAGGLVAIGGSGLVGGVGRAVTIETGAAGRITTAGDDAHGLIAQSIGGGGGTGGGAGGAVGVGGSGGAAGGADTVTISGAGDVTTGGDRAHAIFGQSIGGGGGAGAGAGGIVGVGGSGGAAGGGGIVVLGSNGDILTLGDDSHGIFGQSIGGGGGSGASAGGLVGVGGGGGASGTALSVTLTNGGTI